MHAVMIMQLYTDLDEECCLPDLTNVLMLMQLHPELRNECYLPDVTDCNTLKLIQLHPDSSGGMLSPGCNWLQCFDGNPVTSGSE